MKKTKESSRKYQPLDLEQFWQKEWEEKGVYRPNLDTAKKPFYNLMMFPYPSAEGMHVGNMYAFTGSDIYGRYQRMRGFDVFEPIGLDGFGIHSENYAIKVGRHPKEQAMVSQENFYRQLHAIGNGFDWSRTVETYDPKYYKWTQWIFIQLFKAGLAYRKKAPVNFCPKDLTVLADEQVIEGKCERCGSVVEKKDLEQWFFRITKYADRLLNGLTQIDWAEKVKIAQEQWIGKKEGINITYEIEGAKDKIICFTTRPDTNFGATFIVIGPEHPLIHKITTEEHAVAVKEYILATKTQSEADRIAQGRKKTGVFTGRYAINGLNGKKMPIWVSDFVIGSVGTGAVVGVPGHDIRDFEFAKEFKLPIARVVVGIDNDRSLITKKEQVQEEEGIMVNSSFLDGIEINLAKEKIMNYLEEKGFGKKITTYHLRDWLISRQRYWGPPIPLIHCKKCDWQPVPDDQLPVLLPDVEDWKPKGTGESPLASVADFVKTTCPKCGGEARRETDVSDTFLDSAWYFFRYTSTEDTSCPWNPDRAKKWLPVNMYIGGAEHSVLHLLYSRFMTMFFKDVGLVSHFEEPFTRFYAHGLLIKEGAKMSKSKGNVVIPDAYIKKFGADTLRSYLMFAGPFNQGGDFQDSGIEGMFRFFKRIWSLVVETKLLDSQSEERKRGMNKTVQRVTDDIEDLRYNRAIAGIMEYYNFITEDKTKISKAEIKTLLLLLAPFAPHVTEELWQKIGEEFSIHKQSWPVTDKKYLRDEQVSVAVQINGRLRDVLVIAQRDAGDKQLVEKIARESEKTKKYIEGQNITKVIYVPSKILNFVVR